MLRAPHIRAQQAVADFEADTGHRFTSADRRALVGFIAREIGLHGENIRTRFIEAGTQAFQELQ